MHVMKIMNRDAAEELRVKDEGIASMQAQLRKAVGELHEFETRSDVHSMLVAERALNRELKQTNHEIRKQLHHSQRKFLEHMNVPESEITQLISAEHLQDLLRVNRENSFLREKLNRFLQKPEVAATRVVIPDPRNEQGPTVPNRSGHFPAVPSPALNVFPNPNKLRTLQNTGKVMRVPRVSKEIAMKLVLHEVKRLSSGYLDLKTHLEAMRAQLAEETAQNEHKCKALNLQQERFLEKEKGLQALHRILLERYGKVETDEIFKSLDRAGWCHLFSNSLLQLVDPPDGIRPTTAADNPSLFPEHVTVIRR